MLNTRYIPNIMTNPTYELCLYKVVILVTHHNIRQLITNTYFKLLIQ